MKIIPLTQGKQALIDDDDYERVNSLRWFAVWDGFNWYAATKINRTNLGMHLFILGKQAKHLRIDHRNRNGLDNQKQNLRIVTHQQNLWNLGFRKQSNTSGFKGVSWKKSIQRWVAQIKCGPTVYHLGCYNSEKDAALAYDAAAIHYFGEFACTNRDLGLLDYQGPPKPPRGNKKDNTTGYSGVVKLKHKWQARLTVKRKRIIVGVFDTPEEAHKAYLASKLQS